MPRIVGAHRHTGIGYPHESHRADDLYPLTPSRAQHIIHASSLCVQIGITARVRVD